MNDFNRCNKVTGVHWLRVPVNNLQIRIQLRTKDGILSLPKFDDYAKESHNGSLQHLEKQIEEYIFKWQEKVFSLWEFQRYADILNCLNDTDLSYHEMIKNKDCIPSKISTYIHEDLHLPLPLDLNSRADVSVLNLNSCFEMLSLSDRKVFQDSYSSTRHLFKSDENLCSGDDQWTAMHVVFDNSEYNDESQLLLKQESTLLSIYHNCSQNYIILTPDVNSLELSSYRVEFEGEPSSYEYAVHITAAELGDGDQLDGLLSKLYKKWEKKQKHLINFVTPPPGNKYYYVTIEILTAKHFEIDNLYVEFDIKIPESVQCNDPVHGRTHISKALVDGDGVEQWHFGHIVELTVEADSRIDPPPLQLFFEVISKDWWGRHRTEGYSYLPLSLAPGRYQKQLSCSRPEEKDRVEADSRRFFVGGCHLIGDLDVLAKPHFQDTHFNFVSTGTLKIVYNVISQSHIGGTSSLASIPSTSSASTLLLGAEAALSKYKRARAKLAAATKFINIETGAGDTSSNYGNS